MGKGEKRPLELTFRSRIEGRLVAPLLVLAPFNLLQREGFIAEGLPPWMYLLLLPYGLWAIAAAPHGIAHMVTGRWPSRRWFLASCGLTGGVCIVLMQQDLVGLRPALADGLVYGLLCTLTAAAFLAIALRLGPGRSWWEDELEAYDYRPPFKVTDQPHPVNKRWRATDLKNRGRTIWYRPPSPPRLWAERLYAILRGARHGPTTSSGRDLRQALAIGLIASPFTRYVLLILMAVIILVVANLTGVGSAELQA